MNGISKTAVFTSQFKSFPSLNEWNFQNCYIYVKLCIFISFGNSIHKRFMNGTYTVSYTVQVYILQGFSLKVSTYGTSVKNDTLAIFL